METSLTAENTRMPCRYRQMEWLMFQNRCPYDRLRNIAIAGQPRRPADTAGCFAGAGTGQAAILNCRAITYTSGTPIRFAALRFN